MILERGTIRTLDASLPVARALAIAGDRVVGGVGTHELALPSPDRVDLDGRCVLPGFNDAHVHFPTWALQLCQLQLSGIDSLEATIAALRSADAALPPGAWLLGFGWQNSGWRERRQPSRHDLDGALGGRRVALWSHDYHSLWLSSAALAEARGELASAGGVVELDADGEPTGLLRETAAWQFRDRHVRPSEDELVAATRRGIRIAQERGVTAIHDKDGWLGALGVWQRLQREGNLDLRVWQSLPHELLESLAAAGIRCGLGDDHLRLGYLKVFMDGTLGSGTAAMLDGSGVSLTSAEELEAIVTAAAQAGWPVAVHAIGDRANRDALDAFERTADTWRPRGLRQRIEHAQCVDPADLRRFAELGVACSVQFSHAPADRDRAEQAWPSRLEGAYAYGSLLASGAVVANGSDAPVDELDPLRGIVAAVTRTLDERPAWRAGEAITVEAALHASTVAPAFLAYDERRRGRLVPGQLADLVVLDRDPVTCPPGELAAIRVVATMLGGRWVNNPPPW